MVGPYPVFPQISHFSKNLECILCPVKGGAMKRVNLPESCQFLKNLKKLRKNELNLEKNKYNLFLK